MRLLVPLACLAACTFERVDVGDAGDDGGGELRVIETLSVPASGASVTSMRVLEPGVRYRLRASGTYFFALQTLGDAEYFGFNNGAPTDSLVNVDVGLAVNDSAVDLTRIPRWGTYSPGHIYEAEITGNGAALVAQLHDGQYTDNFGELTLELLARE